MERSITIEDTLQERVRAAIEEVEELLKQFIKDNPDHDETPCLSNDLDYNGMVHEIIDSCVPIYTSEIRDTWYLYGSELEEAYENAGVGGNSLDNDGMSAIYFYISDRVYDWYYKNADDIFMDESNDNDNS